MATQVQFDKSRPSGDGCRKAIYKSTIRGVRAGPKHQRLGLMRDVLRIIRDHLHQLQYIGVIDIILIFIDLVLETN